MEDLQLMIESDEFAAILAATEALDPALLVDPAIGAHLLAFRTGLFALSNFTFPEEPVDPEE